MAKQEMTFIDVQSHFFPPVYREALRSAGVERIDDWAIPEWDPKRALEAMAELGIEAQMLSLSSPGVSFLKGAAASDLAHQRAGTALWRIRYSAIARRRSITGGTALFLRHPAARRCWFAKQLRWNLPGASFV